MPTGTRLGKCIGTNIASDVGSDLSGNIAPSLWQQLLTIFDVSLGGPSGIQRGLVFSGDAWDIDPATSKVGAFVDHLDRSHLALPPSAAFQVVAPTADATLNGAKSYSFTSSQRYVSNRPPSAFRFLHTGPFFEAAVFVSGSSDRFIWSTINFAATTGKTGALSFHGPTSISRRGYNNGSLALAAGPATPFANGVRGSFAMQYVEGSGTPEWSVRGNGSQIGTGDSSLNPLQVDPETTLNIGGHVGGTLGYTGRIAFLALRPGVPTAAELSIVSSALTSIYGVGV